MSNRASSAPAQLAAIICGMLVLDFGLSLSLSGGFLHANELPLGARLLILCYTTAVLIVFSWAIGRCATFVAGLGQRFSLIQWWIDLGVKAAVASLLVLYFVSWATFWQVGKFLNLDAIRFWMTQPLQVFHWIDFDVAAGVLLSIFVAGLAIFFWAPGWIAKWDLNGQRKLLRTVRSVFAICLFWALLGEVYGSREAQQYLRSTMLYPRGRDDMSTPVAHLFGGLRRVIWSRSPESLATETVNVIPRKIISMEQYFAAVDRRQVKTWNVIVLMIESLRPDQLRVYGNKRNVMPAVDALARDSRVFGNVRSQSSQTSYAVLTPLSSHFPLRSATQYAYPENPSYPRLLVHDVLKNLGYRTAVFSSSNENWEGMIHYLQTGNIDHLFHASVFKGPTYVSPGDTFFGNWVMATQHAGSVDDRFTVDEAIQWVDRSDHQPFFMYINFQNSHVPYRIPDGFPRRFSPKEINFTIRFGYFPRDKVDLVKDVYADSLAYVDAQIGRLLDHLRRRGLWDKTLIVLTGDHGQAFYEHGFSAHGGPIFDEVMKVPLIIRAPGLTPAVDPRPAQHIDVPPSVLQLLGLPPHPSFQGRSLFDADSNPNKSIFMIAQTPLAYQYGIIRSGWKLVYDERQRHYLLFDLAADPGETTNLAFQKTSLVKELADRLHAWRTLQIRYYNDKNWHSREYPPILKD